MKLIHLTMSAFGSYGGVQEIDFSNHNHGLFLVSGDTGSGKTTIFDAIMFALYDCSSGKKRQGSMLRSRYADPQIKTYVDLQFEIGGQRYRVIRNPEYQRLSQRRNKDGSERLTVETANVELILPDQTAMLGRKKEVDEKIRQLIGLDEHQFSQIVMIAQGEFIKLLHAPSKERREIFAKIFNTRIYARMQLLFEQRFKHSVQSINEAKDKRDQLLERYFVNEDLQEAWQLCLSRKNSNPESLINVMEQQKQQQIARQQTLNNQKMVLKQKETELTKQKLEYQAQNNLVDSLKRAQAEQEELVKKKQGIVQQQQRLQQAQHAEKVAIQETLMDDQGKRQRSNQDSIKKVQKQWEQQKQTLKKRKADQHVFEEQAKSKREELFKQKMQLEKELPNYAVLNQLNDQIANKSKQLQHDEQQVLVAKKQEMILQKQLEDKSQQVQQLQQIIDQKEKIQLQKKHAIQKIEAFTQLIVLLMESEKSQIGVDQGTKQLEKYNQQVQQAFTIKEQTEHQFFLEQAGILAASLEADQPCPVCGSLHHPQKAVLSQQTPTQQQVEAAKRKYQTIENDRSMFLKQLQKVTDEYNTLKGQIEQQKLICEWDGKEDPQKLLEEYRDIDSQWSNQLKQIEQKERLSGQFKEEIPHLTLELQKNLTVQKELQEKINVQGLTLNSLNEKLKYIKEELSQENEEAALKYKSDLEQGLKELDLKEKTLIEEIRKLQDTLKENEGQLQRLRQEAAQIKKQYKQEQDLFEAILTKYFESKEQYKQAHCSFSQQTLWQEAIEQYQKRVSQNEGTLQALKHQNIPDHQFDLSIIDRALIEVQQEQAALEKQKEQEMLHFQQNQDIQLQLQQIVQNLSQQLHEYAVIDKLNRLVNGKISGSAKLDLETYIQRYYFKQIIHAANQRLNKMNGGQFILKCRDLEDLKSQGTVGLDLDVISLLTQTTMDVRSLSGGESFMAALSMALGLADVIQNTAGVISIDTMFIDEGFGSLDEQSRDRAILILNQLAKDQRLIGIISHVKELKEQIDQQLIVTKNETGSAVHWKE